jgi:hypothetical protein
VLAKWEEKEKRKARSEKGELKRGGEGRGREK